MEKTFVFSGNAAWPQTDTRPVLRLPLQGPPGSQVLVVVALTMPECPPQEKVITLEQKRGISWTEFRLPVPAAHGQKLRVALSLQTLRGKVYLALDPGRDYGRTRLYGPHGLDVCAEACLELQWNKKAPPAATSD